MIRISMTIMSTYWPKNPPSMSTFPIEESTRLEVPAEEGEGVFQVSRRQIRRYGPPHLWVSSAVMPTWPVQKTRQWDWRPGYCQHKFPWGCESRSRDYRRRARSRPRRHGIDRVSFSKSTCIQCKTNHRRRRSDQITDYMTREIAHSQNSSTNC